MYGQIWCSFPGEGMDSMGKTLAKISAVLFAVCLVAYGLLRAETKRVMPASSPTRMFRMGFTPFPPDNTTQAAKDVTEFIKQNADIVAQHMESVPWTEALTGQEFQSNLTNSWRDRKNNMPPNATIYLALNPGRGALADYWGASEHDALPAEFKGKTFSDPIVKQAYLSYCKRAIAFFQPEYLAIGIEVNELVYNAPDKTAAYTELHKYIYTELKKSYPKLPVFASITLHGLLDERRPKADRDRDLAFVKELMPYNDLVGISFYPFFGNMSDQLDRVFDWLTTQFDGYGKPYAVAETGEAAEKLKLTADGKPWQIDGSPERQTAYYQKLFAFAESRRTDFIISFLCIDYDLLWRKIAAGTPPLFQAWQNNGFVDSQGAVRPAYQIWKKFYDMPLQK
jgi:hypothetical protein